MGQGLGFTGSPRMSSKGFKVLELWVLQGSKFGESRFTLQGLGFKVNGPLNFGFRGLGWKLVFLFACMHGERKRDWVLGGSRFISSWDSLSFEI